MLGSLLMKQNVFSGSLPTWSSSSSQSGPTLEIPRGREKGREEVLYIKKSMLHVTALYASPPAPAPPLMSPEEWLKT
jgi:hypothetical protein